MKNLLILISFCLIVNCCSQTIPDGEYLGQTPPGNIPQVFAKNILSKVGRKERVIALSPDGKEIYFTVVNSVTDYEILYYEEVGGHWEDAKTPSFIENYMGSSNCLEPFISSDGTKLLFCSDKNATQQWDFNLWMTEKNNGNWSEPVMLDDAINTTEGEWHPCITNSGNIYFARNGDIYFSEYNSGSYSTAQNLTNINSVSDDWDPYVNPSEEYIIFKSNRSGGFGLMDNYISYKNQDGSWAAPENLGSALNTSLGDDAGDISQDGKYMFFSRTDESGEMEVYWVKSYFLNSSVSANNNLDINDLSINTIDGNKLSVEVLEPACISVLNTQGNVLYKNNVAQNSFILDFTNYSKGIYILILEQGEKIYTKKFSHF